MLSLEKNPIIAAVNESADFDAALESGVKNIILLRANILTLKENAARAREAGKNLFVHADMTEGIARDEYGLEYISSLGVNGIVSTRSGIIKSAKNNSLRTIQRFFAIDSQSVKTAIDAAAHYKPDLIEIMPGLVTKLVPKFKKSLHMQIILGGLIESKSDVTEALRCGADAVSTSNKELWSMFTKE